MVCCLYHPQASWYQQRHSHWHTFEESSRRKSLFTAFFKTNWKCFQPFQKWIGKEMKSWILSIQFGQQNLMADDHMLHLIAEGLAWGGGLQVFKYSFGCSIRTTWFQTLVWQNGSQINGLSIQLLKSKSGNQLNQDDQLFHWGKLGFTPMVVNVTNGSDFPAI